MVDFEALVERFEPLISYLKIDIFRRKDAILGPILYLKIYHCRWRAIPYLKNYSFLTKKREFDAHYAF